MAATNEPYTATPTRLHTSKALPMSWSTCSHPAAKTRLSPVQAATLSVRDTDRESGMVKARGENGKKWARMCICYCTDERGGVEIWQLSLVLKPGLRVSPARNREITLTFPQCTLTPTHTHTLRWNSVKMWLGWLSVVKGPIKVHCTPRAHKRPS